MKNISEKELKCIKTLLGKLAVEDKDAMVRGFTDMRTDHVSEMRGHEAAAMIRHLKGLDPDQAKADRMRKKIIALAYRRAGLGGAASREEKKGVLARLEEWCLKYSYLKKRLDAYTLRELPKLVTQYEEVYKSDLKAI
jgi:hypothetical protein